MQYYWFGDVDEGRCTVAGGDNTALAERLSSIVTSMCGFAADAPDYYGHLRKLCINIAEGKIADLYGQGDMELLQMVRMLDDMDNAINLLTERATEWYLIKNPGFSRKYKSMNAKKMLSVIKREHSSSLGRLAGEIDRMVSSRTTLMKEISGRADVILPNCSALVGGLVAARLMSRAGGLEQFSRMPGSTIQVLGAENALFTHIRSGSPSPKHGIIFQHRRVHNAPRGKVSRAVAGKLSIAARLDYFRGELVPEFIEKAQKRIDDVGLTE